MPLGEAHLRAAVRAFVAHHNEERPHEGLDNERIAPATTSTGLGPIQCKERLGGVLKFYYRDAAQTRGSRFCTRRHRKRLRRRFSGKKRELQFDACGESSYPYRQCH